MSAISFATAASLSPKRAARSFRSIRLFFSMIAKIFYTHTCSSSLHLSFFSRNCIRKSFRISSGAGRSRNPGRSDPNHFSGNPGHLFDFFPPMITADGIPASLRIFTASPPFSTAIRRHSPDESLYGFRSKSSQISIVSCATGIFLSSKEIPCSYAS